MSVSAALLREAFASSYILIELKVLAPLYTLVVEFKEP